MVICIVILTFSPLLHARNTDPELESADYVSIYGKGNYNEAIDIIKKKLNSIYSARAADPRLPEEYVFIKEEERKNIIDSFRKRKVKQFFIEDNSELFNLHLYAARCYFKSGEGDASLNHYFESLRYNPLDLQKDDVIFYEISQVYKSLNHQKAYTDSLETAYSMNPAKYDYSLELGKALSPTNEKKKAIFHLERYVESKGDDIEDTGLFLTLGNLNEDTGKYLETVKYYKKYLKKKNEDGYINFALGYLAYKRAGDYKLALDCFGKSLKYLPETELFRRSKAAEYQGDIYMQDLEYEKAIQFYFETKKYHDKIKTELQENNNKILKMDDEMRDIISSLNTQKLNDRYSRLENIKIEKGKIELANREMNYEFGKLNAGRIGWNLAVLHERLEKLDTAVQYYNEAISYDYNSNEARGRITKLKLKINRGY